MIRALTCLLHVAGLSAGLALALAAQAPASHTIRGSVVDALTLAPLAGAQITLAGADARTVFSPVGSSPQLTDARAAMTNDSGAYELRGITAGRYRLFARRLGYEPTIIDVEVGENALTSRLSVGLVVAPVRLRAIRVDAAGFNVFGSPGWAEQIGRPDVATARQSEYLGTDVRELTALGALEGTAAGDVDIFRALRRLPGVAGADDRATELLVRGGRWDQVRITYDGVPIFNPFHASGTMTGIGADAIGAAHLHPGVRPVSLFSQGASIVDIRSRSADAGVRIAADASMRGGVLAIERGRRDGRGGVVLTGRRSLVDFMPRLVGGPLVMSERGELGGGYYSEIALRADHTFDESKSIALTHLRTWDVGSPFLDRPIPRAGSALWRIRLNTDLGPWAIAHTGGYSAYEKNTLGLRRALGVIDVRPDQPTDQAAYFMTMTTGVDYWAFGSEIQPPASRSDNRWRAGYELSVHQSWAVATRNALFWDRPASDEVGLRGDLKLGSVWAERRWTPKAPLTIDAGIRVESPLDDPSLRVGPSVQGRYRLGRVTTLSAGASRTYQDAQELPYTQIPGEHRGFWIMSGGGTAPARADQASAGIEHWLGESVLVDANVFDRRMQNVAVQPLPSGDTTGAARLFDPAELVARGIEVSARRLAGRVTGSVGYTFGKATQRIDGVRFNADGDRRHAFDATAMLRVGGLRVGSGFTYLTGAPYTRIFSGHGVVTADDTVQWTALSRAEARNAQRFHDLRSVDAFAEWSGRMMRLGINPYVGVRNVTRERNRTVAHIRNDVFEEVAGFEHYGTEPNGDVLEGVLSGRRWNVGLRIVF